MSSEKLYRSAARLGKVQFSPIRQVVEKAAAMEKAGKKVIHFEIGEPDFDTSAGIVEPTVRALCDAKLTHYSPNRGIPELRKAIAKKHKDEFGVELDPDKEIMVTIGAAEGILDTIFALVDQGDEVIVLAPHYVNYENCVRMAGGEYVSVDLHEDNGYQVTREMLEAAVSEKTRLLVVTNPSNPTGVVLNRESLQNIADFAMEHDLLVLSDEIYEKIVYGDVPFCSMMSIPGMRDRTITINGFSKAYAMTGWRIGYVVCCDALMTSILKMHQYNTSCCPTFIQKGLAEGMLSEQTKQDVDHMIAVFKERMQLVKAELSKIPNISFAGADGGFYVMINVSKTGLSGVEFASALIEEKCVAMVPGSGFGKAYGDYIRLSYATSVEDLGEGIRRLGEFVESLGKGK